MQTRNKRTSANISWMCLHCTGKAHMQGRRLGVCRHTVGNSDVRARATFRGISGSSNSGERDLFLSGGWAKGKCARSNSSTSLSHCVRYVLNVMSALSIWFLCRVHRQAFRSLWTPLFIPSFKHSITSLDRFLQPYSVFFFTKLLSEVISVYSVFKYKTINVVEKTLFRWTRTQC